MNNVLYILGAGFSAPLGIPVMADFISKSKDLYADQPTKYGHFSNVFKKLRDLNNAKSFIEYDLSNIEEVLSILEMKSFITGDRKSSSHLKKYIANVVDYYTPTTPSPENLSTNPFKPPIFKGFVGKEILMRYGSFISNLIGLTYTNRPLTPIVIEPRNVQYALLSLNYDMVIERFIAFIQEVHKSELEREINLRHSIDGDFDDKNYFKNFYTLSLAKIHGTTEGCNIIPPTWNKTHQKGIGKTWQLAYELIKNANYIRFLGYSLPITDNHFKYLLITAINDARELHNLKRIDVICRDTTGEVEKRYQTLIGFRNLRFTGSTDIESYLGNVTERPKEAEEFEVQHQRLMEKYHGE